MPSHNDLYRVGVPIQSAISMSALLEIYDKAFPIQAASQRNRQQTLSGCPTELMPSGW
jgi:hypothetical protein